MIQHQLVLCVLCTGADPGGYRRQITCYQVRIKTLISYHSLLYIKQPHTFYGVAPTTPPTPYICTSAPRPPASKIYLYILTPLQKILWLCSTYVRSYDTLTNVTGLMILNTDDCSHYTTIIVAVVSLI